MDIDWSSMIDGIGASILAQFEAIFGELGIIIIAMIPLWIAVIAIGLIATFTYWRH